jgi:hypothetical protein
MNTELTPKQQTSEAIRQADKILVTAGQNPSIDQVTAVLGLTLVLRKLGKKVTGMVSENVPSMLSFLPVDQLDKNLNGTREFIVKLDLSRGAEPDSVRYTVADGKLNLHVMPFKGGWTQDDVSFAHGVPKFDIAIVLGVPSRNRLDRVFTQNAGLFESIPIINIDFHRVNENYGAVNLIEPTASSLSEILVALAESLQNGLIDESIATVLLTGIMASTDRFTAIHTTSKSLTVGAQLMAAGAKQQTVVKHLYQRGGTSRNERPGSRPDRSRQPENTKQSGSVASGQVEDVKTEATDVQAGPDTSGAPESLRQAPAQDVESGHSLLAEKSESDAANVFDFQAEEAPSPLRSDMAVSSEIMALDRDVQNPAV